MGKNARADGPIGKTTPADGGLYFGRLEGSHFVAAFLQLAPKTGKWIDMARDPRAENADMRHMDRQYI